MRQGSDAREKLRRYTVRMKSTLLWDIVEALLRVPTRLYHGLNCNIGEPQMGYLGLALLIAGIDTDSQYRTEIAIELAVVHCTSTATCTGGFAVAFADLASTQVDTGIARRGFVELGTGGLAHNRSFPARVGSLHLQTKGQMWKAESSKVAVAGNAQSHLPPTCLEDSGHLAH